LDEEKRLSSGAGKKKKKTRTKNEGERGKYSFWAGRGPQKRRVSGGGKEGVEVGLGWTGIYKDRRILWEKL